MIAVDTNILVYANREDSPWHDKAKQKLTEISLSLWCIPWPCIHELVAIITHPRIFNPPTPTEMALQTVDGLMSSSTLRLLSEINGYWQVLREVVQLSHVVGPRIHDARIAALCLQHGVKTIWTADRDFSRFGGLKAVNPLT